MADAADYGISIRRALIDDEIFYCAKILEFPDVTEYGVSGSSAYEAALEAIDALRTIYEEEGKDFPAPSVDEVEYSGRVTLRLGKTLHRQAALASAADDLSLNQWLVRAAAYAVGAIEGVNAFNKFVGEGIPAERVNVVPVYSATTSQNTIIVDKTMKISQDLIASIAAKSQMAVLNIDSVSITRTEVSE